MQHCPSNCHSHPLETWAGDEEDLSFTAPDHEYPSYLELRLTVTDAGGLTDIEVLRLDPRTVVLSFESAPAGLELTVGSSSSRTPFTREVIEGSNNSIGGPSPQTLGGTNYAWASWSDGGQQSHNVVASAPATYTAAYQALPPAPSSLVAGYSFDEGLGASAADASGNGNTGAIGAAAWIPTGRFGSALLFNGTSAFVTVNDSASLDLTTGMTLEAWVYPTVGGNVWRDVIYKGPNDVYYLEGSSDSGAPAAGGIFSSPLYGTSALPLNVWSHLAATFDGSNLRLYVNAVQVSSTVVFAQITTSNGALTIGGDASYGQHFAGRIDEVQIHNTARSPSEIQADMNTPVGAPGPPDTQAPTVPTGLSATPVSATQINLAWTASSDNVGVTGYRVERCLGAGCSNFVQVAAPTGTTYSDTGLAAATSYSYRVRAADAVPNLSGYSSVQSATTQPPPDTQPPTVPSGLSATPVSASQINLAWTASTDNVGVTGYRVERCLGAACSNFVQVGTPAGASFNDTGLAAATTYRYRVRAADAVPNLSGYSSIQNATTQAGPDTQPPTTPTGLTATPVSATQVNLAWTASTDNVGVTGYRVERCLGAACANFVQVGTPTGTSFDDTGLAAATTYRYRVRAADAVPNLSGYSSIQNATTPLAPDLEPPSVPSGLSASAVSASQINLSWTASTDNVGVTGYRVERCQGAACSNFVQVGTPTGTGFNDTGLAAATTYRYRVRAADAVPNLSGYSTVENASTQAVGLCSSSSAEWLTGIEHGVVSTAGGGIFSTVTGTPTADNTIVRNGAYSLQIADASNASTVRALRSVTASSVVVTRFAVRLASLPTVTSNLAYIDSGTDLVLRYNASSQRLQLVLGTSTATSATTVSAGTWYAIDLRYDISASPHLGDWRVNGAAQTQVSRIAAATTANGFGMGATANASVYTANYDDVFVATQPAAYPLADSRIMRLVPDSMGTSSGAGTFRNNDGTAIDGNSWQRLDDVPMTSTADYVRQQANSGTSYVEFGLQDTPETCIYEVSVVLAYHAAGSAADNGRTGIFDGATETVVFSGDMSQTGLQYKTSVVTPAVFPWNQAAVNGLIARVGYSTDSSPNPYWDSIMLEAAVP